MTDKDPEQANRPQARLEIRLDDGTEIVLEGDPEFVMSAYDRVKADLKDKGEDKPKASQEEAVVTSPENRPLQRLRDEWEEDPPAYDWESVESDDVDPTVAPGNGSIVWVYRCGDEMRSVYALRRKEFSRSRFAHIFGLRKTSHIFVEDDRIARALRGRAKTLWREMDPATLHRMRELSGTHAIPQTETAIPRSLSGEDPEEKTEPSLPAMAAPGAKGND
jgi:hypothetical protein